jgi:3-dehydroquinate dehydratase-2
MLQQPFCLWRQKLLKGVRFCLPKLDYSRKRGRACRSRSIPWQNRSILERPNLNLLGKREPEIYGSETLDDVKLRCEKRAKTYGLKIEFRQSNHEGELIDWVQEGREKACGLIVNAGALSHSSIGLLDALLATPIPCVEVHLSNIFAREPFRHHSHLSKGAKGVICGLGALGYELAVEAIAATIAQDTAP